MELLWDLEERIGWGEVLKSLYWDQATKELDQFLWGNLIPRDTKILISQLEEGYSMKWLKNGAEKGFIFHAVILALYPF